MDRWMDGRWAGGWMDRWIDGWLAGWVDKMGGWTREQTGRKTD